MFVSYLDIVKKEHIFGGWHFLAVMYKISLINNNDQQKIMVY